jgi:hypothetical protein
MQTQIIIYTAAASVAGAALLYVLLDPCEPRARPSAVRRRTRQVHVHGLVNRGNHCFVNSVIQALASCPTFMSRLSKCLKQRIVLFDLCARTRNWLLDGSDQSSKSASLPSDRGLISFLLFGRKRAQRPIKFDFAGLNQFDLTLSAMSADQSKLTKAMHHLLIGQ